MWHLLAPVVRWPLHSPLRLLLVLAGMVTVVVVMGQANAEEPARAGTTPTPTSSWLPSAVTTRPTAAASPQGGPTAGTSGAASVPAPADGTDAFADDPALSDPTAAASDAAAAFVAAWARPDQAPEAWQARVKPLVTEELWRDGLSETDPTRTPAVAVSGEPVQVAINAEQGVFDVPTTGEWIRVHVTYDTTSSTWLVSTVEAA